VTRRVVRTDPQVVYRRLGDRMFLIHLDTNEIFDLNETSARLWELLAEDGDVEVAESRLLEEYLVDAGQLQDEVRTTLARLEAERLIAYADHG
jgi:hypothetical protein